MDKIYEYKVTVPPVFAYTEEDMTKWLNELGSKGWRLMKVPNIENEWYYFEREVNTK